jgi:hypothetical protein
MTRSVFTTALMALMAAALTACSLNRLDGPVQIQTGSKDGACALAAVGGVLVADDRSGLAFQGPTGNVAAVFPYGFSARRERGVLFLLDPSGRAIAAEGDQVLGAGAEVENRVLLQCQLRVIRSPARAAT